MAALLIRTADGENALRYMKGDVVGVFPDDHVFGRMESLKTWLSEGRKAEDWPGKFAVVRMEGLSIRDAQAWLEEEYSAIHVDAGVMLRRRTHKVNYVPLERRAPGSGRDTLNTEGELIRSWADADVKAAVARKQAAGGE